ncbi:MAG: DUF2062 domain-containing protein [Bacteroidia bacterium]|nr:DUF2062 domain-containing protein [Bacteroidia bacterium]
MRELAEINCCVIIPTYNNDKTLAKIIDGVLLFGKGMDIIVINDGSSDNTAPILSAYLNKIILLTNDKNRGKGISLRKGFKEAIHRGFENAVTIDSDGQHFPDDIPKLISSALENRGAVLMGTRNMNQEGVPGKSSFGNTFSNFWFWIETGIKLPDTQTGFRLYPLEPLKKLKLFTTKFETEIEIIVKLAWRNIKFIPVNISILYYKTDRVSHFRPVKDFTRISILNTYLVVLTLLFYLPKRLILKVYRRGLFSIIKDEAMKTESVFKKSASIGFGFFMGIVPVWGFQLLIGIPLAILFRMNKVLFITAANISIPPLVPIIIFLSYYTGGFFVERKTQFPDLSGITLETIDINFLQYVTGAIILAIIVGLGTFALAFFGIILVRKKKFNLS